MAVFEELLPAYYAIRENKEARFKMAVSDFR